MDPIANLQEQRELATWIFDTIDQEPPWASEEFGYNSDNWGNEQDRSEYFERRADALGGMASRLAELVESLDNWRRNGGFDPYGRAAETVVLVIRDPDYANDIEVFGAEAQIIDIDLGSQFNGPKDFRAMEEAYQQEWVDSMRLEFLDLPENHPARQRFENLVADMLEP